MNEKDTAFFTLENMKELTLESMPDELREPHAIIVKQAEDIRRSHTHVIEKVSYQKEPGQLELTGFEFKICLLRQR